MTRRARETTRRSGRSPSRRRERRASLRARAYRERGAGAVAGGGAGVAAAGAIAVPKVRRRALAARGAVRPPRRPPLLQAGRVPRAGPAGARRGSGGGTRAADARGRLASRGLAGGG